jgi:hypothetical protein
MSGMANNARMARNDGKYAQSAGLPDKQPCRYTRSKGLVCHEGSHGDVELVCLKGSHADKWAGLSEWWQRRVKKVCHVDLPTASQVLGVQLVWNRFYV